MRGPSPQSAELQLARYRELPGTNPLPTSIRRENFIRKNGSLGDFLLVRRMIDRNQISLEEVQGELIQAKGSNFIRRGIGKLKNEDKKNLITYFNTLENKNCEKIFESYLPNLNAIDAFLEGNFHIDEYHRSMGILPEVSTFSHSQSRQEIIERLQAFILSEQQLFLLCGDQGRGKSALLAEFLQNQFPPCGMRFVCIDCRANSNFLSIIEELYRQLYGTSEFVKNRIFSEIEIIAQLRL